MKTHQHRSAAVTLVCLSLAVGLALYAAPVAAEDPDPLATRIDIDLAGAKAGDVFSSFGGLIGAAHVKTDDTLIAEPVTIRVHQVTIRTVLDAICESIGCVWKLVGSEGANLLVVVDTGRSDEDSGKELKGTLDAKVDLELAGAQFRDVVSALSQILAAEVVIRDGLEDAPTVTLELSKAPIRDLLDTVCSEANCRWRFEDDEAGSRTLTFEPTP